MQRRDFTRVTNRNKPIYRVSLPEPKANSPRPTDTNQPLNVKSRSRWRTLTLALMLIVFLGVVAHQIFTINERRQLVNKIPLSIRENVDFPFYYPSKLPPGYTIEKGSQKVENNIFFFSIQNDDRKIVISQQPMPTSSPTLNFKDMKQLDTPAGNAVVGTLNGSVVAVLITKTTLVNVIGSKNVSTDILEIVVRNLRVVSRN